MKYQRIEEKKYIELEKYTYRELEGEEVVETTEIDPIYIYASNETDFDHNGLVILDNVLKCVITEELNGGYYVELECAKDNRGKYLHLAPLNILKIGGQLFRIPSVECIQDKGIKIKVKALHIFYDLIHDFNEDTRAVDKSVNEALEIVLKCNPKYIVSLGDLTSINTAYFVEENPVKSIYDKILNRWGGELYRDNFKISILERRGKISDSLIAYGKNIKGFTQVIDYSEIITRAYPKGKEGITVADVNLGSNFMDSPNINKYPIIFNKKVEFEEVETPLELYRETEKLWGTVDLPKVSYKVDFIDLSKTKEYELIRKLTGFELGDTVTIQHEELNLNLTARVIKTQLNYLTGSYETLELGNFLTSLVDTIIENEQHSGNNLDNIHNVQGQVSSINEQVQSVLVEVKGKADKEDLQALNTFIREDIQEDIKELQNINTTLQEDIETLQKNIPSLEERLLNSIALLEERIALLENKEQG